MPYGTTKKQKSMGLSPKRRRRRTPKQTYTVAGECVTKRTDGEVVAMAPPLSRKDLEEVVGKPRSRPSRKKRPEPTSPTDEQLREAAAFALHFEPDDGASAATVAFVRSVAASSHAFCWRPTRPQADALLSIKAEQAERLAGVAA